MREKIDWFWIFYGIFVICLGLAGFIMAKGDIFINWFFISLGVFAIFKAFWDLSLINYLRRNK